MAITRQKKEELIEQYIADLKNASNAVLVKQVGIKTNTSTVVRHQVKDAGGSYTVAKKRLLLRAAKDAGVQEISLQDVDGSVVLITASVENEFGPLKAINKVLKDLKKKQDEGVSFSFLGGWFDKEWKPADYVSELANLPSKEELISKLLFMLKHPLQSLASVVDQIAKKDADGISEDISKQEVASVEQEADTASVQDATAEVSAESVSEQSDSVAEQG